MNDDIFKIQYDIKGLYDNIKYLNFSRKINKFLEVNKNDKGRRLVNVYVNMSISTDIMVEFVNFE